MGRATHRRFVFLALLLVVGSVVFALGGKWVLTPDRFAPTDRQSTLLPPERLPQDGRRPAVEAADASEQALASIPNPFAGPAAFRGRAVDAASGLPVEQFEVHLTRVRRDDNDNWQEAAPINKAFRSANGRFAWTGLAEGTWQAAINAPGYQQFNLDKLNLSVGATREIALPLRRGYALRGRVVELGNGAPVAGASVSFHASGIAEDESRYEPLVKSREDGSFSLDGVPDGDVILAVAESQHAPRRVAIKVDDNTPPQEIALATGGTIAGTVMTARGEPVKGFVSIQGPGMSAANQIGATGQFAFQHVPASRYTLTVLSDAGRTTHDMTLGQDEINANVALVLGTDRSIRGTVRGLRPEHRNRVQVTARHESKPGYMTASVDQRGAYALPDVPAGNVVVTVFGPSLQFTKNVVVPVDEDVMLDLDYPSGARLSGRVTQGGKPARGNRVTMQPVGEVSVLYRGPVSDDGRYAIQDLPPGDYFMRTDGGTVRRITVVGDDVLNIDIPTVQLAARVVEEGGQVPIVGAHLYVRGNGPETAGVRRDGDTDDFGQFALTGLEPGEIVLMVYKSGYELHQEKLIYASPGSTRTIALRKSDGVEVRVKAGSGRFPRGFTITQTLPGSAFVVDLWMPLNSDGTYHVPSALAGTTFQIGRSSGEPVVIEKWDGQPFELQ